MNGKKNRVKGCWARGAGIKRQPQIPNKPKRLYNLPNFSFPSDVIFTSTQINLVRTLMGKFQAITV